MSHSESNNNGTKNPECCLKFVTGNSITVLCVSEDKYNQFCIYHKMRMLVTLKNNCVKYQELMLQKSLLNGSNGHKPLAGFNPLVPNLVGGYYGKV